MGSLVSLAELNVYTQLTHRNELEEPTFNSYLAKHLWRKFQNQQLLDTDIVSACSAGQISLIRLLVRRGSNVNQKINGWTGLLEVCKPSNSISYEIKMEIADLLIKFGADVNISNDYGHTPLIFATRNKNFNLTYLLLRNGANVNVQNKIGYTPLMYACDNNDAIIVKLLLNFSDNYIDFSLINSGTVGDKTIWDYVINDSKCYKLLSKYSQEFIKIILENLKTKDIYADLGLIICKYLAYY